MNHLGKNLAGVGFEEENASLLSMLPAASKLSFVLQEKLKIFYNAFKHFRKTNITLRPTRFSNSFSFQVTLKIKQRFHIPQSGAVWTPSSSKSLGVINTPNFRALDDKISTGNISLILNIELKPA